MDPPFDSGWSRSYCVWSKSLSTLANSMSCVLLGGSKTPSGPTSLVKNGSRRFATMAGLAMSGVDQLFRNASLTSSGSNAAPCNAGSTFSLRTAPSGVVGMSPANWASSRVLAYFSLSFCRRIRREALLDTELPLAKCYCMLRSLHPLLKIANNSIQVSLTVDTERHIALSLRVVHTDFGLNTQPRKYDPAFHRLIIRWPVIK